MAYGEGIVRGTNIGHAYGRESGSVVNDGVGGPIPLSSTILVDHMTEALSTVFISYSWDSTEHQEWVIQLATALRDAGIDAILDVWDTDLGDDFAAFMEKGVHDSDRVLIVCTDEYVRKANAGQGGVGYEKTIVTGELVRNVGTKKFIPIIRAGLNPDMLVPTFVSTRRYCDFRDNANFATEFEKLVASITHGAVVTKPPLGKPAEATATNPILAPKPPPADTENPTEVYQLAHEFIRANDIVSWRKLAQRLQQIVKPSLRNWRTKHEASIPAGDVPLVDATNEAVALVASPIAMALAGVESRIDAFKDQRGLFDELYHITEWNRAGRVILIELPTTLGFVYQALHGAVCMLTDQPELAVEFATMMVRHGNYDTKAPLWKHHDLVGWPKTLSGSCTVAWKFLMDAFDNWHWLREIFIDLESYKIALISYYIILNFMEYVEALRNNQLDHVKKGGTLHLEIPILFCDENRELIEKALERLSKHPELFDYIIKKGGVSKNQVIVEWDTWASVCQGWLGKGRFWRTGVPHAELLIYLGWK